MKLLDKWCCQRILADTLYHADIRLGGIVANSLVSPYDQDMFWRDYSRIYEIEVYAPDVQVQCMYIIYLFCSYYCVRSLLL